MQISGLHVTHVQHIQPWLSPKDHQSCLSESLLNSLWFQCTQSWQQKKSFSVGLCAFITLHDGAQTPTAGTKRKLGLLLPPLVQVSSVLIYEESLLFTEAMKLKFHKSGLSLPAKADQWSSFKTQNVESGRMSPVILSSCLHPLAPVNNPSLFSFAHRQTAPPEEEARWRSTRPRVTATWKRLLILSHLRCWSVCLLIITHLDIMWGVFVSFALLVAEITGSNSALWNHSQLSGLPCICQDMNIR